MKILFVTDKYFPKPKATVICAQNIIEELVKRGYQVDVLAYKDTGIKGKSFYKSSRVYYIKPDLRQRFDYYAFNFPDRKNTRIAKELSVLFNRIKKIVYLPWYPVYSIVFPRHLMKYIEYLNKVNVYDAVISLYWPFESVLAGYWFKIRNSSVKWYIYTVDPIKRYDYKVLNKLGGMRRWFIKFIDACDLYIYMRSNYHEYAYSEFDVYRNKLVSADIPSMLPNNQHHINGECAFKDYKTKNPLPCGKEYKGIKLKKKENWVYTGSLSGPHYKAGDIIKIFLSLPDKHKRVLHFYSKGGELDEVRKMKRKYAGCIMCHNYVPHDDLVKVYQNADVFISMKYTDLISAKIFEYMSYEKPIVHISGCKNDPNADYIEHYERGLVLPVYRLTTCECVSVLTDRLNEWEKADKAKHIDLSYFKMNEPGYTAEIIDRHLTEEKVSENS